MKTLAIVPAKSRSTGLPGKNTRLFRGSPLWVRALSIGRETCDVAMMSTDEPTAGGSMIIRRPAELAQDDTPMFPVVQHALKTVLDGVTFYPDVVVLLQPTQPLRTVAHVRAALAMLAATGASSVVSVVEIPAHYSPEYAIGMYKGRLESWLKEEHLEECQEECCRVWKRMDDMPTRRQDARKAYSRDGTVYAIRRETIEAGSLYGNNCYPLVIPSNESCNLDTEEDWERAERMALTTR